jgi:hypothetical protein
MAVERQFETITVTASQDLTGHQYKAVGLDGLVAATSLAAKGLARNKALSGDHLTLGYKGQMKAIAGGAINSGSQVGVTTSGFLIAVATSSYVGVALVQVASGDLFTGVFDFNMGQATA